jgi:hypothetical protein
MLLNQAQATPLVLLTSFFQRKLFPSTHIRCKITPSLRASATFARLGDAAK